MKKIFTITLLLLFVWVVYMQNQIAIKFTEVKNSKPLPDLTIHTNNSFNKTNTDTIGNFSKLDDSSSESEKIIQNESFIITLRDKTILIKDKRSNKAFEYQAQFKVLHSSIDPLINARPSGISGVQYNVTTWLASNEKPTEKLQHTQRDEVQQGDGFDNRILDSQVKDRTANLFEAALSTLMLPKKAYLKDNSFVFDFAPQELFTLRAFLTLPQSGYPQLKFEFCPKKQRYFSIGYTGAPSFKTSEIKEIWQPLIWQEKRIPNLPYLTLAYHCPLPTAMVNSQNHTFGVVADPSEFPFDPLPLFSNSRFGVAIRNEAGDIQPLLFAPALGGSGSLMKPDNKYQFMMQLMIEPTDLLPAFKNLAQKVYHFQDYRSNGPHQLNRTLDNLLDYGMSHWSYFIEDLKGCGYSTDVPGAVKNVSALNPLEMALITDNQLIFKKRAYPIMEYLVSREKFLFSMDENQKIQDPSRKLKGPVAPISELTALFNISQGNSTTFLELAQNEYQGSRIRNLKVKQSGDTWQNALSLFRATKDSIYLKKAIEGARIYINKRVVQPAQDFYNPDVQPFFWPDFVPDYIGLFQLYEATGLPEFLKVAHQGALHYTQFVWFSPEIPNRNILVNKGGKAPVYWYLESKGHKPMEAPEETVPAWRLSEIGLTSESSGTSTGHRAILMPNHGPWLYRIGYHTKDQFLMNVARASVVGRYSNFPGYHINTARTTIYEKPDYPLKPFKDLSVNSFHFNHIWPLMSALVDFLVTDAFVKSDAAIDFPAEFIEGYAYLQSKFYGHQQGRIYGEQAWLWMPQNLLTVSSDEVNYLTARGEDNLYIVFTNQSKEAQTFTFDLNKQLTLFSENHKVRIWKDNQLKGIEQMTNGQMKLQISQQGIVVVCIEKLSVNPKFQHKLVENHLATSKGNQFQSITFGHTKAMIIQFGQAQKNAFIYLGDDDKVFKDIKLNYSIDNSPVQVLRDFEYPFEFTVPLEKASKISFYLEGTKIDGEQLKSENVVLEP
jgi:hypothetical protein